LIEFERVKTAVSILTKLSRQKIKIRCGIQCYMVDNSSKTAGSHLFDKRF
jgi:hypothetical protein